MRLLRPYLHFTILLVAILFNGHSANAAWVPGSDEISDARIMVHRCPDGGAPVCARIASDGAIHLLYDSGGLT